ncbi:hypothetical protein PYW08_008232 [Mythimna loreyi]|uniref:Uncharacterized protein n=1 Tax=Mythimna loreyi TaxID=667449 RepID=A0ACC2QBT0_9NEOP|nr:hypothetical protein PYW08_008232 [Mythimna loreyi]
MDCLVGYGSEDENESERYGSQQPSVGTGGAGGRRRDDDTNYDDVNMDMSEDSQSESEPELPPVEPTPPPQSSRDDRRSNDSRERDRDRERERDGDRGEYYRRDKRRESPARRSDRDRSDRRSPRRDDRYRSERDRDRGRHDGVRRGLLGDRPDDREKVPALMDLKPFNNEVPPPADKRSQDARDAVSPRFVDRERRDKERDRERERDRDRHGRRSEERRSSSHRHERRERSRSKSRGAHPLAHGSSSERRASPPGADYRPSSYKVNKKLEVMEKMGLQIKTPDGSMATAQQLRAAACEVPPPGSHLPSYYNPTAVNANKIMDQVQKRKLLWSNKNKSEAEEAAKWSGTRFAQDSDGKQVSKFMRLMGIKEPAAVKTEPPEKAVDPIKKQEELFQAMQAQYEVARATTHTMRGVGLGFQRGQY